MTIKKNIVIVGATGAIGKAFLEHYVKDELLELLQEKFEIPLIIRIDWACCLQNDNVCRDYYLNEIEQVPGMLGTDSEKYDWFEKLSKSLLKMV